jgi:hypothetical protein
VEAYAHEFLQCEVMIDGSGDFQEDFLTWESILNNGEILNYFILLFKVL